MKNPRVFGGRIAPRGLTCGALLTVLAFGGTSLIAQDQPGGPPPARAAQPATGPTPGPLPLPMAEWTFMVFLNGDNNLEPDAIQDFQEMAAVGSTPKVNVVVQFDRTPGGSTEYGDWTQTLRFRVTRGMTPTTSGAVRDIGEVNMGDGNVLKDFIQWTRLKYPAKKYMLVIWDHGQGWRVPQAVSLASRIVGVEGDLTPEAEQQAEARRDAVIQEHRATLERLAPDSIFRRPEQQMRIPYGSVINGTLKSCSIDSSSGDQLYNREIQDALLAALGAVKLDVIGFDACLMAMAETSYAMRQLASYGVFSEELEPGTGWNYTRVLSKLVANPTMVGAKFAPEVVKAYQAEYGPTQTTTLSAANLGVSDGLAVTIDSFADSLVTALSDPAERTKIRQARDACNAFGAPYGLHGIDFSNFCKEIINRTGDPTLKAKALGLKNLLGTAVVQNYAGQPEVTTYGATGLAIYYPKTKSAFMLDPDHDGYLETNTNYPVQFVQDHRWDNFLQEYYQYNP